MECSELSLPPQRLNCAQKLHLNNVRSSKLRAGRVHSCQNGRLDLVGRRNADMSFETLPNFDEIEVSLWRKVEP